MESPNKNKSEAVLKICVVLSFLSTFVNLALSFSLNHMHQENVILDGFVSNASIVSSDFEQSLLMYTETTQEAIQFVDTIRPDTDTEYIQFISAVEELGRTMNLDVKVESLDPTDASTLRFSLNFFGNRTKLTEFIQELEHLNYYVRIEEVTYKDLALVATQKEGELLPNIQMIFRLYVK